MTGVSLSGVEGLTPLQIVEELDKHIVGQAKAKRAVAIALRNRYRRARAREQRAATTRVEGRRHGS